MSMRALRDTTAGRCAGLLAALLLAGVAAPATAARFDFDATPGRLPKDVVPTLYRLTLEVDPAAETFSGWAQIEVDVRRPVTSITVNALQLSARSARLQGPGGERELKVDGAAAPGQWRLSWDGAAPLPAGPYLLRIDYEGHVERTGQGLFRVDCTAEGKPAQMLATQLQPTHARRVFPGFDEPSFRAAFEIEAVADARWQVVSNMPAAAQTRLPDGRRSTRFERTPSMPSYLVALAAGEFDVLREKAGLRQREGAVEAAAGSGRKKETVLTR